MLSLIFLAAGAAASSLLASPNLPAVQATTQSCTMYGTRAYNCFEGPGLSFTAAATVNGGHSYTCTCSKTGDNIDGNSNWDYIPDDSLPGGGCYVPQFYTTAPCVNSTLPAC